MSSHCKDFRYLPLNNNLLQISTSDIGGRHPLSAPIKPRPHRALSRSDFEDEEDYVVWVEKILTLFKSRSDQ